MKKIKIEAKKRIPGIVYLVLAITGFYTPFAMKMFGSILDPAQWYEVVTHNQLLFSSGIISFYIMNITWLFLGFSLYTIFKETSKSISHLLLLSVVSGSMLVFIIIVMQSMPLFLISLTHQDQIANPMDWIERTHFLYILSIKSKISAYLFYSLWLFPLAILFYKTKKILKIEQLILSISLVIAGIGYMADFLLFHFFSQHSYVKVTDFTFYGEVVVLLWLLVRGINNNKQSKNSSNHVVNKN